MSLSSGLPDEAGLCAAGRTTRRVEGDDDRRRFDLCTGEGDLRLLTARGDTPRLGDGWRRDLAGDSDGVRRWATCLLGLRERRGGDGDLLQRQERVSYENLHMFLSIYQALRVDLHPACHLKLRSHIIILRRGCSAV